MAAPWNSKADINGDGQFTISDVWGWTVQIYYLPGDLVIEVLIGTAVGNFFEIGPDNYRGIFSLIVSAIIWGMVVGGLSSTIADFQNRAEIKERKKYEKNALKKLREQRKAPEYRNKRGKDPDDE